MHCCRKARNLNRSFDRLTRLKLLEDQSMLPSTIQTRARVHANTRNANPVTIRLIQLADAALLLDMFGRLSPRTHYQRFMRPAPQQTAREQWPEMVALATPDPQRLTLIATVELHGKTRAVGLAQLVADAHHPGTAEVALLISDDYQGQGLGFSLLELLAQSAMARGIHRLQLNTMAENLPIQRAARRLGLPISSNTSAGETTMTISLLEA